jgi:hypothetical protein
MLTNLIGESNVGASVKQLTQDIDTTGGRGLQQLVRSNGAGKKTQQLAMRRRRSRRKLDHKKSSVCINLRLAKQLFSISYL